MPFSVAIFSPLMSWWKLVQGKVIKTLKWGYVLWRMKGPVLALTWMDKKPVHAAGTYTQAPADNLPEVNWKQKVGTIQKIKCL